MARLKAQNKSINGLKLLRWIYLFGIFLCEFDAIARFRAKKKAATNKVGLLLRLHLELKLG